MKKCTAQTEGTITKIKPVSRGSTPKATVVFRVGGAEYTYTGSAPLSVLNRPRHLKKTIEYTAAPDAISSRVPVFYNPDKPAKCYVPVQDLGKDKKNTGTFAWVLLALSAVCFILIAVI
jgi:hypothetical protein